MTVNILTPGENCLRDCRRQFRKEDGSKGDIRRCEHGRYWMCMPGTASLWERWERLSWLRHPIFMRRAVRAFTELKPEVKP